MFAKSECGRAEEQIHSIFCVAVVIKLSKNRNHRSCQFFDFNIFGLGLIQAVSYSNCPKRSFLKLDFIY